MRVDAIDEAIAMVVEQEAEAPLAAICDEIEPTQDELNRVPDGLRWTVRAELPPGLGIVSQSTMMIFTPLA